MTFDSLQRALADIRAGRMVILVDDEDRENEGDLCMAAECVTPEAINFMAKYGRGLICLTLTEERLRELQIPMMVADNTSIYGTAFTVSIEARHGVSTGISAADRAHTILTAVNPRSRPDDLVRPGHVFPLRARRGGVLVRTGQTEGSVDLSRIAGLQPAGVICEIMNDDGTMARMADLERFAREHDLQVISIADIIQYRLAHESMVRRLTTREVEHPRFGRVTLHVYGTVLDDRQHLAVVKGPVGPGASPVVRVQAGSPVQTVLGDLFTDDRKFMEAALARLAHEPQAVLVCLDRSVAETTLEQRVTALGQGEAPPPVAPDSAGVLREFGVGAQILRDLGLTSIRLLSNHPRRIAGLDGYGLRVEEIIPLSSDGASPSQPKLELING
jgi:3,4-dihydroxy 2-butanone 4-phosphate synthase/GTP cyclohydrolase II